MRAEIDSTERIAHERQQLACETCGVGNPLLDRVVDRGFLRCGHCGTAMPVAGAGAFTFDGNGFVHVISPGRSSFELLLGRLFPLPGWFLFLLLGEFSAAMLHRILGRGLGLERVAWIPLAAFVVLALALFLMMCVQQRILLVNNRVQPSWRLFGIRVGQRRFGSHGLKMRVRKKWPYGVLLRPRAAMRVWIGTEDVSEAVALKREVEIAVLETRQEVGAERLRCPGCGAPVASRLEVVERGGVECSHCESAVVAVKGGVVLANCTIGHDLDPQARRPETRRRFDDNTTEWRLGSELSFDPVKAIGLWSVGLLLGGMSVLFGLGVAWLTDEWRSFGLIFAMIFVPLGLGVVYFFTVSFFGSHRIALDRALLEHDLYLGRLRIGRTLVPLARLLSFQAKQSETTVDLELKTATRGLSISLPQRDAEGAAVALELVAAVRDGLLAMERDVEWRTARPSR
ncbi:MAG: hypothetical protein GY716_08775 [bacterium]|nr:hypothetical protein [bacterium]